MRSFYYLLSIVLQSGDYGQGKLGRVSNPEYFTHFCRYLEIRVGADLRFCPFWQNGSFSRGAAGEADPPTGEAGTWVGEAGTWVGPYKGYWKPRKASLGAKPSLRTRQPP